MFDFHLANLYEVETKNLTCIIHKSGLKPDVTWFLLTPALRLGLCKQSINKGL